MEIKGFQHKTSHDLKSLINNVLEVLNLLYFSQIDDTGALRLITIL
jgi:hypothetical protein